MSKPLVSVIVLNYNGLQFLNDCFKSVLDSSYPNFEVIMVDNDSTDSSVSFVKQNFPSVKVFETGVNGGYSLAYNMSFEIARGKYFICLNNDITVEPDWIDPLVEQAEKDDKIAALQPKLVSMLDPTNFEYAGASGGFIDRYGFPFLRGRVFDTMEKDEGQYDDTRRIFWATGASCFIRASVLKESEGFDEDFVHHMEEIDLCYRLNLLGYKLKVVPKSKIYHYGGATIKPDSYKKMYWNHRNSIFMLLKNLESKSLLPILFKRWILDLMAIAQSALKLNKRCIAIIAGHWWIAFNMSLILKKRKRVQEMRKIGDEKIFHLQYPKSLALQYHLKGKKTFTELMEGIEMPS